MVIQFHIHYNTDNQEFIGLKYRFKEEGTYNSLHLHSFDHQNWIGTLEQNNKINQTVYYKYFIRKGDTDLFEWGRDRCSNIVGNQLFIEDSWRERSSLNNIFLSDAFTKVIFNRESSIKSNLSSNEKCNHLIINVLEAAIPKNTKLGIVGSSVQFGDWKVALPMEANNYPNWSLQLEVDNYSIDVEYKLVLLNHDNQIIFWELGANRRANIIYPTQTNNYSQIQIDGFNFGSEKWRGSGVAIPVFSLRSTKGFGIGEFLDLKLIVDWASQCGLNLVQVLPVNDTLANLTWQDSYPYAAISVFALHPLYINVESIGTLKDKKVKAEYEKDLKVLNLLQTVDFELVLDKKMKYFRALYSQEFKNFTTNPDAQKFLIKNEEWLKPYAVFCHLRDVNKTSNFGKWGQLSEYSKSKVEAYFEMTHQDYEAVLFYVFLQFHADRQLKDAHQYAVSQRVILKGDLPIGIYRYSCDAWVAPELYNMNEQAGAPPDDFSVLGQNWGFPTYNWEEMAKDNYSWWQKRMQKLSEYFDALRIDHILGFFRIWQIPTNQIEGTLGMFNPRLPFHIEEIKSKGKVYDLERWTKPYIRGHFLERMFGQDVEWVVKHFLKEIAPNIFLFQPQVSTQNDIKNYFDFNQIKNKEHIEKGLLHLVSEVLMIEEPNSNGQYFNPRITLNKTISFEELPDYEKPIIQKLYSDYYFSRHNEFWKRQAYQKLPALLCASNMLICGEDLGMIPDSVAEVMKNLNIITLEIQRMPKGNLKFGDVAHYPYLSVCSPSCHDMSTIRGWWESDYENASQFYYDYLQWYGLAPRGANTNIVEGIVKDHLASPSILAIFPIQDLVGLDEKLRRSVAQEEQINEPSNPKHYWRYRFHLNMEELIEAKVFNNYLKNLIKNSGR